MFLQCYLNEPEIISVLNCFLMCNRSQFFFWPSTRWTVQSCGHDQTFVNTFCYKNRKKAKKTTQTSLQQLFAWSHTSTKLGTVLNSSIQVLTAKALNDTFLLITEENTVIHGYGERKNQEIALKLSIYLDVFGSLGMCLSKRLILGACPLKRFYTDKNGSNLLKMFSC